MNGGLRIAYLGPAARPIGGVAGVAGLILDHMLDSGHEIDCYVARREAPLPQALQDRPRFKLIDGGSRFEYDAWYSRTELTKLVTGQATRAIGERRLMRELAMQHRARPYDLLYQFSHLEVFGLRGLRVPPLIVHPETHTAGELRWLIQERSLARQCEPAYRRVAARIVLSGRTAVQRRHARLPTGFICPSRAFQTTLCADYGIDISKTRVVPNPIDLDAYRPRESMATTTDRPIRLLYAGRISVRKGVECVIELSHRLSDLAGKVTLEIVGHRTQWSDYRGLLAGLNKDIARYSGGVPEEAMPRIMAEADVLIQPSKYEPFGLTVAEALASGVPVVATDEVGATESVSRECARIVRVGDTEALEREVRVLVDEIQRGARTHLASSARAEAQRLFDPRRVVDSIVVAFEELVR